MRLQSLFLIPFSLFIHNAYSTSCASNYSPCLADGTDPKALAPGFGSDLVGLYQDLISSVEGHSLTRKNIIPNLHLNSPHGAVAGLSPLQKRDDKASLCCRSGTQCLLLKGRKVSFCWDKFTTNFYFSDSSFGSITSGLFTTSSNDRVNLILGNFTLTSGTTGNIYSSSPDSKPNLSTLHLPSQFTAKGEGTAIPGSELGTPPATAPITASGSGPHPTGTETNARTGATVTVTVSGRPASATQSGEAAALKGIRLLDLSITVGTIFAVFVYIL